MVLNTNGIEEYAGSLLGKTLFYGKVQARCVRHHLILTRQGKKTGVLRKIERRE